MEWMFGLVQLGSALSRRPFFASRGAPTLNHTNRLREWARRLRVRAWVRFDWQNDWGVDQVSDCASAITLVSTTGSVIALATTGGGGAVRFSAAFRRAERASESVLGFQLVLR